MDHFMAQEREQFRKRTVLKEATDADEPLCPVTTSPGGNHAVRPFTTEYRKLSTPVFLVQLIEELIQSRRSNRRGRRDGLGRKEL